MPITAPSRAAAPAAALAAQSRARPPPPRIPPPVTPRRAATLAHRTSSFCDWDTKPGLSHQEDVPVSITSPQTNAPSALSYYYGEYFASLGRLWAVGQAG